MDRIEEYEKETRLLYDQIDQIWPDNNKWYDYTHRRIIQFITDNQDIFNTNSKILNAGSGGSIYKDLTGVFYHVDISDKFIKNLPNSYVASVERMPFDSAFFDASICVGSVINYCNALSAISEIYRVLKHNSFLTNISV